MQPCAVLLLLLSVSHDACQCSWLSLASQNLINAFWLTLFTTDLITFSVDPGLDTQAMINPYVCAHDSMETGNRVKTKRGVEQS